MVTSNQKAVLGSMLIDEHCVPQVLATVTSEDFTDPNCRILFLAARRLYNDNKAVDPVTVLGQAGGSQDLYDLVKTCMEETPTAANVGEYLPLLKEEARLVKVQGLAMRLLDAKVTEQARDLVSQLNAIMVDKPGIRTTNMEKILSDFVERQQTKVEYLPWGLSKLDTGLKVIGGKFVILGGYPSDGKTALALMMAWRQSQEKRVGFFSLETDDATIGDRLVSRVTLVTMNKIKDQNLNGEDYDTIASLSPGFIKHKLEIVDAVGMTAEDIISYARYRRYDVIYIDYLQLIKPTGGRNRTEEVSGISIALHNGARAAGLTVVALSQLSRAEGTGGKFKAPRMRDLRESGQIEQDADVIMLLYRDNPDDPDSRRTLSIEKNKEGELGIVYLHFDGPTQTFRQHINQTAPPKRKEPEYRQTTISELSHPDPDCPFEEDTDHA